jgi:hypothetical protein
MTKYQVHLHLTANKSHGIAEFDSMTEAYCYLLETIAQMLFFLPGFRDAEWLDDDMVHLIGDDGTIVGTATVICTDALVH